MDVRTMLVLMAELVAGPKFQDGCFTCCSGHYGKLREFVREKFGQQILDRLEVRLEQKGAYLGACIKYRLFVETMADVLIEN